MRGPWQHFPNWRAHWIYGEAQQRQFGFGHDFRPRTIRIVQHYTGAPICDLIGTGRDAEYNGRLIRQGPVHLETLYEASKRLHAAQHPNAVALRNLIRDALAGMEKPLFDEADRE